MIPKDIWKIKSSDSADKTAVILGGVHGDELTGIEVVKKLKDIFGIGDKVAGEYVVEGLHGQIYLGFGNPQAIKQCTRAAGTGLDLNRSFNPDNLKAEVKDTDQPDVIRARELTPILEEADCLFDIHCTSSPSVPFIITTKADLEKLKNFSKYTSSEYILLDPKGVYVSYLGFNTNYSTDDYVNNFCSKSGVGLCYETGYEKDVTMADKVVLEMLCVLREMGIVSKFFLQSKNIQLQCSLKEQEVFFLDEITVAKYDGFEYADGMEKGWQEVREGQLVGRYLNGEEEKINKAGMFLFPTGASKVKKGHSLYYIAKPLA